MDSKKWSQKLLRTLAEERATYGYGSAANIDQRVGKSEGYLGRVFRGEIGLQIEMLFLVLEVLEADPSDFFARAVGTQINPKKILKRLERQDGETFGQDALDRLEQRLQPLGPQLVNPEGVPAESTLDLIAANQTLQRLDQLRFSEAGEAESQALLLLKQLVEDPRLFLHVETQRLLCKALGVVAAIRRVQANFAAAARCLRLGLELSRHGALLAEEANILQRTSYLLSDQGEHRTAVELARQACDLYIRLHDLPGVGKTLVDGGIMSYGAGDFPAAILSFEGSLRYLPGNHWHNRFSAYLGLGWIYVEQGQLETASEWVRRAAEIPRTQNGYNWLRLDWLKGEIALQKGDLSGAEEFLQHVLKEFIRRENSLDIALVSLRLAKVLLLAGQMAEVRKIAARMMYLLKPLKRNKIASAAIYEFTRAALTGELTISLLERTCQQIKKGCSPKGNTLAII